MIRFRPLFVAGAAMASIVLLLALGLGTSAGTRLAVAAAAPLLPAGLTMDGLGGSILGGIRADRIRWSQAGTAVEATDFRGAVRAARLLEGRLSLDLEAAALRTVLGLERGVPTAPTDPVPWSAPLDVTASVADVRLRAGDEERVLGAAEFAVTLTEGELRVERLRVENPEWRAEAHGRVELAPRYPILAEAVWHARRRGGTVWEGALDITGDAAAYHVRHRLRAPVEVVSDGDLARTDDAWSLRLSSTWDAVTHEVAGATVRVDGGRLDVVGEFRNGPVPRSTASLRLKALQATVSETGVDARLAAEATVQGEWPDTGPRGTVQVHGIRGALNGRAFEGRAAASIRAGAIEDLDAVLSVGENTMTLAGSLGDSANLRAHVDARAVQEVWPLAAGGLNATLQLTGPATSPRIDVEAVGSGLRWEAFAADRAELHVAGDLGEHRVRATAAGPGWEVSAAMRNRRDVAGWSGSVESLVASGGFGAWSLDDPVVVSLGAAGFAADNVCLSEADGGEICATLAGNSIEDGEVAVQARGLALRPWLEDAGVALSGRVAANARFVARGGTIDGDFEARLEEAGTVRSGPLDGTVRRAELRGTVSGNRLEAAARAVGEPGRLESRVVLDDVGDTSSALSGMLELEADDLSAVTALVPALAAPRGRFVGLAKVGGSLSMPIFEGTLRLHEGGADIPAAGVALEDVFAEVRPAGEGRLALGGSGRLGTGTVTVDGEIDLSGGVFGATLAIDGNDLRIVDLPGRYVVASPTMRVTVGERISATGTVRIPSAEILVGTDVMGAAARSSRDAVVHSPAGSGAAPPRRYDLDVVAELGNDVRIAGEGLAGSLEGSLRVTASAEGPLLGAGRLALRDGRYSRFGQELAIDRGELTFNGPLAEPSIDLRASRRTDDVTAGVALTGSLGALHSALYSEPAMDDAEILSYLLTGRPLAAAGDDETAMLAGAAFDLGLQRAGPVAAQVRRALGLEDFRIGGEEGRLVAGSRLGERFWLEYAYGLADRLGALLLRVELTEHAVLEATSGAGSALDLVYSVERE